MNQNKTSVFLRSLLPPCLAAAIGFYGWSSSEWLTPLILLIPILWGMSQNRTQAFLTMFAYYIYVSRGIVPGAYVFFQDGNTVRAVALWLGSSAILAAVWAVFHVKKGDRLLVPIKLLLVMIILTVPPIGLIGWTNPLLAIGYFFPKVQGNNNFIGVDTEFGRLTSGSSDPFAGYERMKTVFQNLYERRDELKKFDNIVLPETICGMIFSENTKEMWESEARRFFDNDPKRTLFMGAEFPTGETYDNALFSVGANSIRYAQRVPVLFSMYRPWEESGANAYLFKPEIIELADGTRVGAIICYEQFLAWSWILMLAGNDWKSPDVVICTTNNWWCRDTSLPLSQKRSRELWSRLLGVPVVNAENR